MSTLTFANSTLVGSTTACKFGGNVYGYYGATVALTDGSVATRGYTTSSGASVYVFAQASFTLSRGAAVTESQSVSTAGAIMGWATSSLRVDGGVVANNTANVVGAMATFSGAVVVTGGSYVVGNRALGGPSGAVGGKNGVLVRLEDSTFEDNAALKDGGVLEANVDFSVSGCVFRGNHAERGGALSMLGTDARVSVARSTFERNGAAVAGGAAYVDAVSLRVASSRFTGNAADGDGGALAVRGTALSIAASSFDGNAAAAGGGAVAVEGGELLVADACAWVRVTIDFSAATTVEKHHASVSLHSASSGSSDAHGNVMVSGVFDDVTDAAFCVEPGLVRVFAQSTAAHFAGIAVTAAYAADFVESRTVAPHFQGHHAEEVMNFTVRLPEGSATTTFSRNVAAVGGAVHLGSDVAARVADAKFFGNAAASGGGFYACRLRRFFFFIVTSVTRHSGPTGTCSTTSTSWARLSRATRRANSAAASPRARCAPSDSGRASSRATPRRRGAARASTGSRARPSSPRPLSGTRRRPAAASRSPRSTRPSRCSRGRRSPTTRPWSGAAASSPSTRSSTSRT